MENKQTERKTVRVEKGNAFIEATPGTGVYEWVNVKTNMGDLKLADSTILVDVITRIGDLITFTISGDSVYICNHSDKYDYKIHLSENKKYGKAIKLKPYNSKTR